MIEKIDIKLHINGRDHAVRVEPNSIEEICRQRFRRNLELPVQDVLA